MNTYPYLNSIRRYKESIQTFAGLNHNAFCSEEQFYDMKNMSTKDFPFVSTRPLRGKIAPLNNPLGLMSKEELVWVDEVTENNETTVKLFINGVAKTTPTLENSEKKLYKMGAYIIIFPDKVWYNTKDDTSGTMDASQAYESTSITMTQVNAKGENITIDGQAVDGHYKLNTTDGKTTLMVYSATAKMWMNVATTYFKISATDMGKNFEKGDGVKITVDMTGITWDRGNYIFVNDDGDGLRSNNFAISDKGDDYIIVTGLLDQATRTFTFPLFKAERKAPDMKHICECQNRLWGCSLDGHEVYASKLGDCKNWNCFAGISTDSWAATVGSDGVFTGAFAYMGYPIFFKEDSILKISISSYGAHSYKEIECRGVEEGSDRSLTLLNELLYYKGTDGVCVYDGNFPQNISDALGKERYTEAIAAGVNDKYYISMKDANNSKTMFVFDTFTNLWSKEDALYPKYMVKHDGDIFYIDQDNYLYCINHTQGTEEQTVSWFVESGNIGYRSAGSKSRSLPDRKYLARMNIRMNLYMGSHASFYVSYDSSDKWEYVFGMSGKGINSFAVPIRPHRCDHFKIKIVGSGEAKILSITKEYEEGSDV